MRSGQSIFRNESSWQPPFFALIAAILLLSLVSVLAEAAFSGSPPHSPTATPMSQVPIVSVFGESFPSMRQGQILIQRHLYTAAVDSDAKQPVWVAYCVERSAWDTNNVLSRNFNTPRDLRPHCLEPSDYTGSGYELGHLYGLQFVSADARAAEVNQLCVVAAQRPGLNKGPWLRAENRIKKASEAQPVTVLAGQLWLAEMPALINADEPHKVASHCWIIFAPGLQAAEEAYLIPQTAAQVDELNQFSIEPAILRPMISDHWTLQPEVKP